MRKKTILYALVITMAIESVSPILGESEKKNIKKKRVSISLNTKKKVVKPRKVFTIKCKGMKQKIHWKLSKKSIVSVKKIKKNSIRLKAKKTGSVVLTATWKNHKLKCRIIVQKKKTKQTTKFIEKETVASIKQTEEEVTAKETEETTKQTEEATKQTEEATAKETEVTTKQTEENTTQQATITETTSSTWQKETESSLVHAVLAEDAKPVTAEDLAHRDNEAQQEIKSSFESPTYSGEGTFYGGGYRGGCCNLDSMTNGYYICALNRPQYNTGQMSGAYIELTGPIGTLKMLVADELPEGKHGDIDLNTLAFPHVAKVEDGRVPITWKIIPFPTEEPIKYWIKKDSTEYWMQIQIRNHRYPIQKLELKMQDGTYKEVPKRNYNFFEIGADGLGMPGKGPFTFRVTDIYGQVLEDTIPLMPGYIIDGKKNFEY